MACGELTVDFVFAGFRNEPPFWYTNASARSQLGDRQIGFEPEGMTPRSFLAAAARSAQVLIAAGFTPAFAARSVLTSIASGDQSFG